MYVFLLALPALESTCMKSTTEIKLSSLCYYKYVKSEPWKYILITDYIKEDCTSFRLV